MARITIKRPDGSTESQITFTSSDEARAEIKTLRAKIKAAGEGAKGWTVALQTIYPRAILTARGRTETPIGGRHDRRRSDGSPALRHAAKSRS